MQTACLFDWAMGHSEARTTMNIYTHASYEQAKSALTKILSFEDAKEKCIAQ